MTGNGGLIAEEGLAEEMFLPVEGTLAMSVAGGLQPLATFGSIVSNLCMLDQVASTRNGSVSAGGC